MKTVFAYAPNEACQAKEYLMDILREFSWAGVRHVEKMSSKSKFGFIIPAINVEFILLRKLKDASWRMPAYAKIVYFDIADMTEKDYKQLKDFRDKGCWVEIKR